MPGESLARRRLILIVAAILAAGFAARLGVRMAFGEAYFWKNGYLFLYAAAKHLAAGGGFCNGTNCPRPPLYLTFLALTTFGGKHYLLIVIPQALLGACTALFAFLIGRQVFNTATGVLACAMTAFYPYYVVHDTALQDTAIVTFCMALAVWLLLRANERNRRADWLLAGLALGSMVLARASTAPAIGAALLWVAVWGRATLRERLRAGTIVLLALSASVLPWLIYTNHVAGAPVLSTDIGYELWVANNPDTFSRYPARSIDRSTEVARAKLAPQDRAELRRRAGNQIAIGDWYFQRALGFMRANPWRVVQGGMRKLVAGFSWRLNPYREPLAQAAYAVGYVPVAVLGIIGMVLARRRPATVLVGLLFLAFMAVSFVFWAHTSHRTHLDIYWIVFAASVVDRFRQRLAARTGPHAVAEAKF